MTTEQQEIGDCDKFQEKLIKAADFMGMREGEFAVWIGYTIGHVSKVKNGHLPVDRTLNLLLETLLENHRLKSELASVRGAANVLFGAGMPYPRHTEAPSTLNETASSTAAEPPGQTPAEIFAAAKAKVLARKPPAPVPIVPKSKPARGKRPRAADAPPGKDAQP